MKMITILKADRCARRGRRIFLYLKADHCAWRGRYVYLYNRQLARIVLDPNNGVSPTLKLALPIGWYKTVVGDLHPKLFEISIPAPRWPWRWANGGKGLRGFLYRISRRFWFRVDGRFSNRIKLK